MTMLLLLTIQFQSTPPVKAATFNDCMADHACFISIHAAREGGDGLHMVNCNNTLRFQSTPPVKAATLGADYAPSGLVFQSTPPVKAATRVDDDGMPVATISIHAAREGGDFGGAFF